MSKNPARKNHNGSTSRNQGRRKEGGPVLLPILENSNVIPPLPLLNQERRNSLGMSNGRNMGRPTAMIPTPPGLANVWQMRSPSEASTESPVNGPNRGSSASSDSQGTNNQSVFSDGGDTSDEHSEEMLESGRKLIVPQGKKGFRPIEANRAVMDSIKKCYKTAVNKYKEAPLEVREVWFNEFKKRYRWSPDHDFHIRRNFNAKATDRLADNLYQIRVRRAIDKPPPDWIPKEVYKELEKIWEDPKFITESEKNKRARNTSHGDDGPFALHTCGSIPMSEHRIRLTEKNGGQEPSPDVLYRKTHMRKDKSFVSQKSQKVMESVEQLKLTQPTRSESEIWLEALGGPKKGGRVPGFEVKYQKK